MGQRGVWALPPLAKPRWTTGGRGYARAPVVARAGTALLQSQCDREEVPMHLQVYAREQGDHHRLLIAHQRRRLENSWH